MEDRFWIFGIEKPRGSIVTIEISCILFSTENCHAKCLSKVNVCFGWSFDDFDGHNGTCFLKSHEVCCDQINNRVCKPGSVSGLACSNNKEKSSCWSTHGLCPCTNEQTTGEFCAGCSETEKTSGTVSFYLQQTYIHQIDVIRAKQT